MRPDRAKLFDYSPMQLPSQVFFEPTPAFLTWLARKRKPIIDAGAGIGHFQAEMFRAHPTVKMASIDYNYRDDAEVIVHHADARVFNFPKQCIVTICRPSHDGWLPAAIDNALALDVRQVLYVGLLRNVDIDLCGYRREKVFSDAGQAGEHAWKVTQWI